MGQEIHVRVLKTLSEIEEIRPFWESWPGHRDSDIDMFLAVAASNPETVRPHVIVAYQDGRPDAILIGRIDLTTVPLRVGYWRLRSPRVRLLTFVLGAQRGNSSPEVSELLLREALQALRRGEADLGRLDFQRVDTALYRLARSLPGILGRDHAVIPQPHWYMELSKTYGEVLKGLSHDLRKEIRRTAKRISADFESVEVKCFEKPDELETLIRDIESVAAISWQRRIGSGFRDPERTRELLLFQAKKGWLRAYVLYVDAKPRAFWLGSLYEGVFFSEYMAFDPDFGKYSPGTVLQAKVIEDLCGRNAKSIDLGLVDLLYKRRFGTSRHEDAELYLYPPTMRGLALCAVRTLTFLVNETPKALLSRLGLLSRVKAAWAKKKRDESKVPGAAKA
jgi:CelD/BcsL family acetyltransferase involved in cellulose biosynthesis